MHLHTNVGHRMPYLIFYVDNLARSTAFYQRLGLRVRDFPIASSMGTEAKALSIQGTTLVLMSREAGAQYFRPEMGTLAPSPGHAYPSFPVANLHNFHKATLAAVPGEPAIECLQEPREDFFGFVAIYRDPDGLLFSVIQARAEPDVHGVVLSGGGALGSFEVGVLKSLAEKGAPAPGVITGTSVGAFNAAALACELGMGRTWSDAVSALSLLWLDKVAGGFGDNGVFRFRGDVFRLLSPGMATARALQELAGDAGFFTRDILNRLAYAARVPGSVGRKIAEVVDLSTVFSTQPLRSLLHSSLSFDNLCKSPAAVKLATTDWQSGHLRLFTHVPRGHNVARKIRSEEAPITAENFLDAVMASTAIPGVFPAVDVMCEGKKRSFVDGGLVMNSPLNPAIESQATTIHLICVNPQVNALPHDAMANTMETMTRALVAAVAGFITSDLNHAKLVNRIAGVVRRKNSDEFYTPITVHRYHPMIGNLGGVAGLLDFSKNHVEELMGDGIEVGATHDCEKAQCILAD